ncbi:amidohydrolase family protein [Massilia sp. METH4]|uniref:amidohydrolase family protein n=1 Tax=Massilia sp. METH4 TaxID=3123041 RepID=UPI0030CD6969
MDRRAFLTWTAAALALPARADEAAEPVLLVDHHQHLFSPAMARLLDTGAGGPPAIAGKDVIALLDTAGIRRAALLSVAYVWGSPARKIDDEYTKVRAENDFNGAQAALYPDRLRAFCSFNPLKNYALEELERCAALPDLKHGIKLHFGNSDVQLDVPEHVARLRQVFAAANAKKMAIVVHMRASVSKRRPYGAAQARIFLDELLPAAPDVTVQVAHLAGTGPGYDDPPSDEAVGVLAEAVAAHDARTKRLWFDVATMANPEITPPQREKLARRIRQIGADRVLFGSDAAAGKNLRPRESWAAFRQLPLTEAEFKRIAGNVAPYMR